jgi:fermentation-respiration switch protein FrsA (DUF1100 family)
MKRWAKATGIAGILIAVLFAVAGVVMFFNEESFVFFPEKRVPVTPASFGLPFEEVRLRTADGVTLGAWWIPVERPRGAAVLAHGNAGNIAHRIDKAALLCELGLSVLLFDYRGYGNSGGSPTEDGTYMDMEAAVEHVRTARGFAPEQTLFWGESIGAAVAVEAATRQPCAGLVVESGFTSLPAMAKAVYPWLPGFLVRLKYDSLARIPAVKAPKLILHGPSDKIVPYPMSRSLFDASTGTRRFADLRGGHNDGGILASPEAQESLRQFLNEVLGPPAK